MGKRGQWADLFTVHIEFWRWWRAILDFLLKLPTFNSEIWIFTSLGQKVLFSKCNKFSELRDTRRVDWTTRLGCWMCDCVFWGKARPRLPTEENADGLSVWKVKRKVLLYRTLNKDWALWSNAKNEFILQWWTSFTQRGRLSVYLPHRTPPEK
jgi:hypothetical protein